MIDSSSTTNRSVSALANRVRMMQADLADRPADQRMQQLEEEIRRETSRLQPEDARAVYEQLMAEFPGWGEATEPQPIAPVEPPGATHEQWNDPAALIAQLSVVAGKEPARRRAVLDLLKSRGLVAAALPEKAAHALNGALQLPPQMPIDPVRTIELLLVLMDFVRKQESFINGVWITIARGIGGSAANSIIDIISRYIATSDFHPQRANLKQELETVITLLDRRARVLAATLRTFSQQHAEKFAPAEIETMVNNGLFANKFKGLWDRYEELCGGSDRDHLESEMRLMQTEIIKRIWNNV